MGNTGNTFSEELLELTFGHIACKLAIYLHWKAIDKTYTSTNCSGQFVCVKWYKFNSTFHQEAGVDFQEPECFWNAATTLLSDYIHRIPII